MKSRERVLAALNHQEADRMPIDFGGHRSSGIAAIAYAKLRKSLGLAPRPIRVYDPIQQLAIIDDDVLDLFHVDAIELGRGFALEDEHWVDWTLPDGTPCQMPRWAAPERIEGEWILKNEQWPDCGADAGRSDLLRTMLLAVRGSRRSGSLAGSAGRDDLGGDQVSPRSAGGRSGRGTTIGRRSASPARADGSCDYRALRRQPAGGRSVLYRIDNFLMLLAGDPDRAHEFLDRLVELHLANLERFLAAVGDSIDIILFGDDLGMQNGPQMSPAMYEEFFKPRHARMWTRAKELANVKVMLHCCGGVQPLLRHLIEAGLDAINPVQISCTGMDPRALKQQFGKDLTFWGGGCDTHRVLSGGTPDEIRQHVRHQVEILKPGGGFVFQQVHNVLANVPPENIVAMFEAAYAHARY